VKWPQHDADHSSSQFKPQAIQPVTYIIPAQKKKNILSLTIINTDLVCQQINLKTLDLCGNPLNGFPPIISSRTLETLCLEGKAAVLPHNTAAKFPQLADVTLVASSHSVQTELDSPTQYELSNLNKLITLSIGKLTS
jgi:hypothetical protein